MPGSPGVDHFGVRTATTAGAAASWARIAEAGLAVDPSHDVVCCHATKNEAWLHDPDGIPWEVYAVTNEQPDAAPTPSTCCTDDATAPSSATGCCA